MTKKRGQDQVVTKEKRQSINMDFLREMINSGHGAKNIMETMNIKQIGSLRNAVFMLSQKDMKLYTVPGLIDETRFKPMLRVGKSGIRLPVEKIPFKKGSMVVYENTNDDGAPVILIRAADKETNEEG